MAQYKDFDLDIVKVTNTATLDDPQQRITTVILCTAGCKAL